MAQTTTQCITITHILYDNGQRYIRYVDRKHFLTHFGHDHGRRIYCDDQPNTTRDIALLFFKSFFLYFFFFIFSYFHSWIVRLFSAFRRDLLCLTWLFLAALLLLIIFEFSSFSKSFFSTFLFPFINFFCVLFMWLSFPFNILSNIFSFSIHFGIICRRKIVLCT